MINGSRSKSVQGNTPSKRDSMALKRLENDLDRHELSVIGKEVYDQRLGAYTDTLRKLLEYFHQKKDPASRLLARVLDGLEKCIYLVYSHQTPSFEFAVKPVVATVSCQVHPDEFSEKAQFLEIEESIQFLKSLRAQFNGISLAKVVAKLRRVYESLKSLHTRVPELSALPEKLYFQFDFIQKQLDSVVESIQEAEIPQPQRFSLDKAVQVEIKAPDPTEKYVELLREKELQLFNLRVKFGAKKKPVMEVNSYAQVLEAQCAKTEEDLMQAKHNLRKIEKSKTQVEHERNVTRQNLVKKERMTQAVQKALSIVDRKNKQKIEVLTSLQTDVQILSAHCTLSSEKLTQLENAWKRINGGAQFTYENLPETSLPNQTHAEYKDELTDNYVDKLVKNMLNKASDTSLSSQSSSPETLHRTSTDEPGLDLLSQLKNAQDSNKSRIQKKITKKYTIKDTKFPLILEEGSKDTQRTLKAQQQDASTQSTSENKNSTIPNIQNSGISEMNPLPQSHSQGNSIDHSTKNPSVLQNNLENSSQNSANSLSENLNKATSENPNQAISENLNKGISENPQNCTANSSLVKNSDKRQERAQRRQTVKKKTKHKSQLLSIQLVNSVCVSNGWSDNQSFDQVLFSYSPKNTRSSLHNFIQHSENKLGTTETEQSDSLTNPKITKTPKIAKKTLPASIYKNSARRHVTTKLQPRSVCFNNPSTLFEAPISRSEIEAALKSTTMPDGNSLSYHLQRDKTVLENLAASIVKASHNLPSIEQDTPRKQTWTSRGSGRYSNSLSQSWGNGLSAELKFTESEIKTKIEEISAFLHTVYPDSTEMDKLPKTVKLQLIKAFEGHSVDKCSAEGICRHLKRAMEVRKKTTGALYPLKKQLMSLFSRTNN